MRSKPSPAESADFVITDLKMAGMDGSEVLRRIRELDPTARRYFSATAYGSVEAAVEAMKLGAMDFLTKPFSPEVVRLKVERALELRAARRLSERLQIENERLRSEDEVRYREPVGSTEVMRKLYDAIGRLAKTDSSVAIYGESGTGKELVARAIHNLSRSGWTVHQGQLRRLTETLLESELFRHERGAFTGAVKRRLGRLELADGGIPLSSMRSARSPGDAGKAPARAAAEGTFERVGGEQTIKVDLRVLSATHRDLPRLIEKRPVPRRPFYRLQVVPLSVRRCATAAPTSRDWPPLYPQARPARQPRRQRDLRRRDRAPFGLRLARQRPASSKTRSSKPGLRRRQRHHCLRPARPHRGEEPKAAQSDPSVLPLRAASSRCPRSSTTWSASSSRVTGPGRKDRDCPPPRHTKAERPLLQARQVPHRVGVRRASSENRSKGG